MKARPDVIAALTDLCGGRLLVGDESRHTLISGELAIEVHVVVRHHAPAGEAATYRAKALEELRAKTFLVRRCACTINRGGRRFTTRPERDCSGRVVAAVVYKFSPSGTVFFNFVCGIHRKSHGVDGKDVLAVVDLPEHELAPIRMQAEIDHAAWVKKCDEEFEAREAARKQRECVHV